MKARSGLFQLLILLVPLELLAQAPSIDGCSVLPADNIWNVAVDTLPVDARSDAYVSSIGSTANVHPEFGSGLWNGGPIGIPYSVVTNAQPNVNVSFYYADESDPGPYPIPPDAPIEGGPNSSGDRHVLVLNRDTCMLYEVYDSHPNQSGGWDAGSGAVFDLRSHALRPDGWTSADAAGLPILPGLIRYDEVAAGEIRHAVRFTAPQTRRDYVWPARHDASSSTNADLPPMGQRFRLKASVDISGFSAHTQVILRALKKYGMILADNGSSWFITGAPDERWDNDILHELDAIQGSDFEAVDVSSLQISSDSGQARVSEVTPPHYADFDSDDISDIVVWRPSLGMWFILTSSTNFSYASHLSYQLGLPGDVPLVGEFDGDGQADLAVWRSWNGTWYLRQSSSGYQTITAIQWGLAGDKPLLGDYDGDGRAELVVYRATVGAFYALRSSSNYNRDGAISGASSALYTILLGGPGNDPVAGDFNGDGRDEFITIWQLIRFWSVKDYTGQFLWSLPWGYPGDTPLACDWDGSGVSDRLIIRRTDRGVLDWYAALSSGGVATLTFGLNTDVESCNKDFDNDGKGDITLYRDGLWYVRRSSDQVVNSYAFGLPGDVPL